MKKITTFIVAALILVAIMWEVGLIFEATYYPIY
jgi:hypothetical protein